MTKQSRPTIMSKLDKSRYLEKVGRTDKKNGTLPSLIRMKPEEVHDDLPEGYFDD